MLNAYFVSDLHIGSLADSRGALFLEFLRSLGGEQPISHLFLLGDIFDLWIAGHRYFVDTYRPIADEIVRLRDAGVDIHYFEGNHDLYLRHYWGDRLGITVHEGPAYLELGTRTVRLEHGDQMDPDDRGYHVLRFCLRTPPVKFLMPRLPGRWVVAVGNRLSAASRRHSTPRRAESRARIVEKVRSHARRSYDQQRFDLIVSGHVHVRDRHEVREGTVAFESVNLGTWLDAPCYFRLEEAGGRFVELAPSRREAERRSSRS